VNIKIYRNIALVIILIIFMACKENPTEMPIELNPLLTEEMVRDINLEPGIRIESLELNAGIIWNYSISVPEINDTEKVPLIIGLHGGPLGSSNGEGYLRCLADPGFKKLDAIIFAPDAGEFYFWEEGNYSLIITLIEYAKKYWPIDTNKIIVSGYSNGGITTWFFGVNYPELFSAAIPIASYIDYNKKLKIPFFVIHGENDELFPLAATEDLVNSVSNKGSDIQLHVIDGLSHYTACSYDNSLRSASDWLLSDVWE
jgi:dipeptidyl aminopeptidase/acylaminoacyl peptidase